MRNVVFKGGDNNVEARRGGGRRERLRDVQDLQKRRVQER